MRDLTMMASLITIAKQVREMGYSPGYLKAVTEATNEEHTEHLEILKDFNLVYDRRVSDTFGVYKYTEILWSEDY